MARQAISKKAFLLVSILLLLFLPTMAGKQKQWPQGEKDCGDTAQLLLDSKGKPLRFSANQLKEIATTKVTPKYPSSCRCEGTVLVQVFVNIDGEVACTYVVSGHPLLKAAAQKAAKEWKFKPVERENKPGAFTGFLLFNFKSHGEVTF